MNYANTKIYKIVCNKTGKVYIGSTTKKYLSDRLAGHRRDYEAYLLKEKGFITSFYILENNDYEIVLIENFPCQDKNEKNARERNYIENIECVNKQHPGRSKAEWYEINKVKCLEKMKDYREANSVKIKEYKQVYFQKNKY